MNKIDRFTIFESYTTSLKKGDSTNQVISEAKDCDKKCDDKKSGKPMPFKKKPSAKKKALLEQVHQISESVQELKQLIKRKA